MTIQATDQQPTATSAYTTVDELTAGQVTRALRKIWPAPIRIETTISRDEYGTYVYVTGPTHAFIRDTAHAAIAADLAKLTDVRWDHAFSKNWVREGSWTRLAFSPVVEEEIADESAPCVEYVNRQSWLHTRVVLAYQLSGWRRGLYPQMPEVPVYQVVDICHGNGVVQLFNLTTGALQYAWEHPSQLIEVDEQGNHIRGEYAELPPPAPEAAPTSQAIRYEVAVGTRGADDWHTVQAGSAVAAPGRKDLERTAIHIAEYETEQRRCQVLVTAVPADGEPVQVIGYTAGRGRSRRAATMLYSGDGTYVPRPATGAALTVWDQIRRDITGFHADDAAHLDAAGRLRIELTVERHWMPDILGYVARHTHTRLISGRVEGTVRGVQIIVTAKAR